LDPKDNVLPSDRGDCISGRAAFFACDRLEPQSYAGDGLGMVERVQKLLIRRRILNDQLGPAVHGPYLRTPRPLQAANNGRVSYELPPPAPAGRQSGRIRGWPMRGDGAPQESESLIDDAGLDNGSGEQKKHIRSGGSQGVQPVVEVVAFST